MYIIVGEINNRCLKIVQNTSSNAITVDPTTSVDLSANNFSITVISSSF